MLVDRVPVPAARRLGPAGDPRALSSGRRATRRSTMWLGRPRCRWERQPAARRRPGRMWLDAGAAPVRRRRAAARDAGRARADRRARRGRLSRHGGRASAAEPACSLGSSGGRSAGRGPHEVAGAPARPRRPRRPRSSTRCSPSAEWADRTAATSWSTGRGPVSGLAWRLRGSGTVKRSTIACDAVVLAADPVPVRNIEGAVLARRSRGHIRPAADPRRTCRD